MSFLLANLKDHQDTVNIFNIIHVFFFATKKAVFRKDQNLLYFCNREIYIYFIFDNFEIFEKVLICSGFIHQKSFSKNQKLNFRAKIYEIWKKY